MYILRARKPFILFELIFNLPEEKAVGLVNDYFEKCGYNVWAIPRVEP